MTPAARLLYYELGLAADDDGFVEGYDVCAANGIAETYLDELAEKRYICEINNDGLCWITCWNENNYIQADRYHKSPYNYLLADLRSMYPLEDVFMDTVKNNVIQLAVKPEKAW